MDVFIRPQLHPHFQTKCPHLIVLSYAEKVSVVSSCLQHKFQIAYLGFNVLETFDTKLPCQHWGTLLHKSLAPPHPPQGLHLSLAGPRLFLGVAFAAGDPVSPRDKEQAARRWWAPPAWCCFLCVTHCIGWEGCLTRPTRVVSVGLGAQGTDMTMQTLQILPLL